MYVVIAVGPLSARPGQRSEPPSGAAGAGAFAGILPRYKIMTVGKERSRG